MTNTKGMTMPQIDDAELFGNAEDQRAYEDFCANQEAVEKFTLDKPALVCRWRMSNKKVPMLNRHIRALSERLVQGEPLTHNMLSWAKQHVEWSLDNGELAFVAPADECLCGTATLIEQLAQTKGIPVTRVDIPAQLKGALFLVSDEHGVVPATETNATEADAATVAFFAEGYEKLRARR